jgi:hypothetical protein
MSATKAKPDKSAFTPEDALLYIQQQMGAMWRKEIDALYCPYCHKTNERGCLRFCCELFAKAFQTTLYADRIKAHTEFGEKLMEAIDKHQTKRVIQ